MMRSTIFLAVSAFVFIGIEHTQANEPLRIPLIFDTDIGNDCDDVLALGMIHALQDRQECELLAVTITKDHELAAPFVDAVNTFYGRGDIPIGVCRSGVTSEPANTTSWLTIGTSTRTTCCQAKMRRMLSMCFGRLWPVQAMVRW